MTKDNTYTLKAKYMFAMGNGDMFDGYLNVQFDREPTDELWNAWWNEVGNDFIVDCARDAVETLGVKDQEKIAFVVLAPEGEYKRIIQCCSAPHDWGDNAITGWNHMHELDIVPHLDTIIEAYPKPKPELKLVWGTDEDDDDIDFV